uniref:Uncharacterized protein n=1 Tax=Solanum demissum TaxID=50514 RepID=Q0KIV8_SOLDE|nr:hypothetical protein SDM1_19t00020 [Solanum demissum]
MIEKINKKARKRKTHNSIFSPEKEKSPEEFPAAERDDELGSSTNTLNRERGEQDEEESKRDLLFQIHMRVVSEIEERRASRGEFRISSTWVHYYKKEKKCIR